MYPHFRTDAVTVKGRKVTVKVSASTQCGENINAQSTATARDTSDRALADATRIACEAAKRNLGHEHDSVVRACKRRGTHNH